MRRLALLAFPLVAPSAALAQGIEWRLDHRNQPSILVGGAVEELIVTGADEEGTATGVVADIAFGFPGNAEGGEFFVGLRVGEGQEIDGEGRELRLVAPHVFYRVYGGLEEWKTFFDVGAMLRIDPLLVPSARVGLGLQWDFHENWGTWLAAGGSIGYGDALVAGLDLGIGLQFRFGTAG